MESGTQVSKDLLDMLEDEIEEVKRNFEKKLEELDKKLEDLEDAVSAVFMELEDLEADCKGSINVNTKENITQELVLQLIEKVSFNGFDGKQVVSDLRRHKHLWKGVFMLCEEPPLAMLRDIVHDFYHADTMYILPSCTDDDALVKLAESWRATSVEWIEGRKAMRLLGVYSEEIKVLKLWWD